MKNELNESFWTNRWANGETGWDTGDITPPLKSYIDKLQEKDLNILIPGCGSGYEGRYLWQNGFQSVFLLDISPIPITRFTELVGDFPKDHLLVEDFFLLDKTFDLVIEQTFFCALSPDLREKYVRKMKEIIKPGGKIAGLLFGVVFDKPGPPFGGTESEYRELFAEDFEIIRMEVCNESIGPRLGNELFFEMIRK